MKTLSTFNQSSSSLSTDESAAVLTRSAATFLSMHRAAAGLVERNSRVEFYHGNGAQESPPAPILCRRINMGCSICKYKGSPVREMSKRCLNPDRNQIDDETIEIVGGYPVTCDKFEPAETAAEENK